MNDDNHPDLPWYQCFKQVQAHKIAAIEFASDGIAKIALGGGWWFVTPSPYREQFKGSEDDLGYYVRYPDGYASWSPTEAFESGYALIDPEYQRVISGALDGLLESHLIDPAHPGPVMKLLLNAAAYIKNHCCIR